MNKWSYYGIQEEIWSEPPIGYVGMFERQKFTITVHYRANDKYIQKWSSNYKWLSI